MLLHVLHRHSDSGECFQKMQWIRELSKTLRQLWRNKCSPFVSAITSVTRWFCPYLSNIHIPHRKHRLKFKATLYWKKNPLHNWINNDMNICGISRKARTHLCCVEVVVWVNQTLKGAWGCLHSYWSKVLDHLYIFYPNFNVSSRTMVLNIQTRQPSNFVGPNF